MEANPYQPPEAKLVDEKAPEVELADRAQRFLAAFIDGLISMVYVIPIVLMLGVYDYARRGERLPYHLTVVNMVLGFALFVLVQGYFLKSSGQTIGKKAIGIRIVDLDGRMLPFAPLIGWRYLPFRLMALIPFVGGFVGLIDVLFIFREDRRCLHDLLAGTRVVKVA